LAPVAGFGDRRERAVGADLCPGGVEGGVGAAAVDVQALPGIGEEFSGDGMQAQEVDPIDGGGGQPLVHGLLVQGQGCGRSW